MYLSGKQTALHGQIMQTLAEPHEEQEIRELVGDLVMQLLGAQFYASFVADEALPGGCARKRCAGP